MKRKIVCILIILATLMIMTIVPVYGATGKVKVNNLNLRKEASTDSGIVEKLNEDDEVEIISDEGEWYNVKHNSNTGYVKKEYVIIEETQSENTDNKNTQETNESQSQTQSVSTENEGLINDNKLIFSKDTSIRIIPAINGNIIGEVKSGENLEIISMTNHWYFVEYNEISGWVPQITKSVNAETNNEQKVNEENEEREEQSAEQPAEQQTEQKEQESEQESGKTTNEQQEVEQDTASENTDQTAVETTIKYVKPSSIYFRKGPSTDSEVITSLIRNTDVKVIGEEGDWYKVNFDGEIGYIRKDLLADSKSVDTSRSGDSINRDNVEKDNNNGNSNQTGEKNINETPETETNQVVAKSDNSSNLGKEIIDYAYTFLGVPYVYGTAGPKSFDCSGFTSYVYKHFGYSIPRSSLAQSTYGREVTGELQTGDIVLFLDYETMDKVGHVGIYIGDGNFIHASSGSGYCVKVSTLNSGSYKKRYAGARRII